MDITSESTVTQEIIISRRLLLLYLFFVNFFKDFVEKKNENKVEEVFGAVLCK